jgi:hypothetical protein
MFYFHFQPYHIYFCSKYCHTQLDVWNESVKLDFHFVVTWNPLKLKQEHRKHRSAESEIIFPCTFQNVHDIEHFKVIIIIIIVIITMTQIFNLY